MLSPALLTMCLRAANAREKYFKNQPSGWEDNLAEWDAYIYAVGARFLSDMSCPLTKADAEPAFHRVMEDFRLSAENAAKHFRAERKRKADFRKVVRANDAERASRGKRRKAAK